MATIWYILAEGSCREKKQSSVKRCEHTIGFPDMNMQFRNVLQWMLLFLLAGGMCGISSADDKLGPDFSKMLLPIPPQAKLKEEQFIIWGASMVRDKAGQCHLFYSRWPRKLGHRAWVTHSEVAHAVSDDPLGPYKNVDVALPARGTRYWDGLCTHGPTVHIFDGKYYLYYLGTTGDGKATRGLNMLHRNNQRIGVAVADHPKGPWKRFDTPLIDVSPDPDAWGALMTSTPAVCRRPDGSYLLFYKCAGTKHRLPYGGPIVLMAAIANSPVGPFAKHETPVFTLPGVDLSVVEKEKVLDVGGVKFPVEDPCIWVQEYKLWAIAKDFRGRFTNAGAGLALFQSEDGLEWSPAEHPFVSSIQIHWRDAGIQKLSRLERPQLWLDNGVPAVLFLAVFEKGNDHNYNVHIPLHREDLQEQP